jgi:hypothetical protein
MDEAYLLHLCRHPTWRPGDSISCYKSPCLLLPLQCLMARLLGDTAFSDTVLAPRGRHASHALSASKEGSSHEHTHPWLP